MTAIAFEEGDEVRALVTDPDLGIREGARYLIEFAYDDVPDAEEPLYSLKGADGMAAGMEARQSQLVRTRTWADLNARRLPTPRQIIEAVPVGWDWRGTFEITEADIGGETDAVELYGRTAEGLPFGVRLKVKRIWQTDF